MGGERWWNRKISARKAEWVLFALALVAVLLVPLPRYGFLPDHHGFLSSHGLTLAAHLSSEHHFLMYNRIVADSVGVEHYEAYNRFSIVPFALIRCAMEFGGEDLFSEYACAQKLMLLFMLGAMFCAFLALKRLRGNAWLALTTVMLAFSSYYFVYYGDMVFNDMPSLFGCMLVFHGLVTHLQENRPKQLLAKSLVAVAMGWQVYAMLLPSLAVLWWKNRRTKENALLAAVPVVFGALLLAFNLANECIATQKPLMETSTVKSILFRFGDANDDRYAPWREELRNAAFLKEQLWRMGTSAIPGATNMALAEVNVFAVRHSRLGALLSPFSCAGVAFILIALGFVFRKVPRFPALSLLFLAFCWTLPMKHFTAFHDFQSLFFVGIPIVLYDGLLGMLPRKKVLFMTFAVVALISMGVSWNLEYLQKAEMQADSGAALRNLQRAADEIRDNPEAVVFVDGDYTTIGGAHHAVAFALPNAVFTNDSTRAQYILTSP